MDSFRDLHRGVDASCFSYGDLTLETLESMFAPSDFVVVKKEAGAIAADEYDVKDEVVGDAVPQPFKAPVLAIELPPIQVSNIVCKTHVRCKLNLDHCCMNLQNSERTNKFPALFVRMRRPPVTLLLYRTGTVVCTGACTYEDNAASVRRIVRSLVRLGYEAVVQELAVENILANFALPFKIQISKISADPRYSAYCEAQQSHFACVNFKEGGRCVSFSLAPCLLVYGR